MTAVGATEPFRALNAPLRTLIRGAKPVPKPNLRQRCAQRTLAHPFRAPVFRITKPNPGGVLDSSLGALDRPFAFSPANFGTPKGADRVAKAQAGAGPVGHSYRRERGDRLSVVSSFTWSVARFSHLVAPSRTLLAPPVFRLHKPHSARWSRGSASTLGASDTARGSALSGLFGQRERSELRSWKHARCRASPSSICSLSIERRTGAAAPGGPLRSSSYSPVAPARCSPHSPRALPGVPTGEREGSALGCARETGRSLL
jgi:hypothetical protein